MWEGDANPPVRAGWGGSTQVVLEGANLPARAGLGGSTQVVLKGMDSS